MLANDRLKKKVIKINADVIDGYGRLDHQIESNRSFIDHRPGRQRSFRSQPDIKTGSITTPSSHSSNS